jgi:hypothetical protein
MPYCKKNKLIFIHVPKNAGTAVLNSPLFEFEGVRDSHVTASWFKQRFPELWCSYKKIAIVRNPWDRVVSNFEYAKMQKSYWHSSDGTTAWGEHSDYALLKDSSFDECVDILAKSPEMLKHPGWLPQVHFVCDADKQPLVDKVFYQEKLTDDREFNSLFPGLTRVNTSSRMSSDYKDYYSLRSFYAVYNHYKEDIALFDYEY